MSREITPFKDLVSLFCMVRLLLREKPNIVHTHTPKAGLIGMLGAWLVRVPHRLHTVAGMPLMESRGLKRVILLIVEKLTYACATQVYPNSKGLEKFIIEESLTSVQKLKVLGNGSSNGIDTQHFSRTQELDEQVKKIEQKYTILKGDFVFVFVGRIVADKGINELLNAFDKLSTEHKNVKLLLVGSFEEKLDPLVSKSKEIMKHNENILHVGFQEDVRAFFATSQCLVFPSYREGFPNVVMQAGSMGLPSIVSDINGCNEIIQEKQNGIIIPPKDTNALYKAMKILLTDTALTISLAKNSREMIVKNYEQEFVWQCIKDEYDKVIQND